VAEHQTAGRGRTGRSWSDVPGAALLVSVLLRPAAERRRQELSLVAGLAAAEAVEAAAAVTAFVKWPNDVVVADRKVAGILLEADDDAVVCGIGVNVNGSPDGVAAESWAPAGSLSDATGRHQARAPLLAALLTALETRYDEWVAAGLEPLRSALTARDWLTGRTVRAGPVTGTAAGLTPDGRYEIRDAAGAAHLIESGELDVVA
jgi:BirA family biotin operon repressor/biotin-[acetyl-CoA-carboxylase] ligase